MNPLAGKMGAAQNGAMGNAMQVIRQAKHMISMLNMAKDPQKALMQAASQNPMLGSVMQMCQGRNPKDVFYTQCNQMGVNPDEVINMLR